MLKIPKVDVQTATFDGLIPGTLDGRFDMVGDSIHYTKARVQDREFLLPHLLLRRDDGGAERQPEEAARS